MLAGIVPGPRAPKPNMQKILKTPFSFSQMGSVFKSGTGLISLHFMPPCFLLAGKRSINVTALMSPGNIGQSGLLGCTFEPDIWMGSIVIRWAKVGVAGLVHEFRGGKDHLQEQDVVFQGRTAIFADQVMGGNASLELREVQLSDAGTYRCSVTTSRGSGAAVLRYQTGGEEMLSGDTEKKPTL